MLDKLWGLGCHKFQQYNSLDGFAFFSCISRWASWGKVLWCGFSPWVFQLAMVPVPPSHLFGQTSNVAGHIIVKLIHPSTSWMERTKTRFDHFQLLFVVLKRGRDNTSVYLSCSLSLSPLLSLRHALPYIVLPIAFELDWYRTRRIDFSWMDQLHLTKTPMGLRRAKAADCPGPPSFLQDI